MPSSPSANPGHAVAAAAAAATCRPTGAEGFASILDTQREVDALCKEHGVPAGFTARPAGGLRANSAPPPGAICVYSRALEAGMRVPLQGFFRDALAHFGLAPAQITPNGWRVMAGFLVLCHSAGVPPSLAVFRCFFLLYNLSQEHKEGWYTFRPRDGPGLRFTGMPNPNAIALKDWKREFFFLSCPDPWPCAVEWVEPSKSTLMKPVLTAEENKWADKLLRVHGGAAVDLRTYLCNGNLAAAMIATTASPPPPSTPITPSSKGMDPSVYDMMKTMLAEKAAAQASASALAVKAEPGSNAAGSPALCGEKRGLEEANYEDVHDMMKCMLAEKAAAQAPAKKRIREEATGDEEVPPLSAPDTPLPRRCSTPPGFSGKPRHIPSLHDGDTTDWEAARELLQGAVAPPLERAFAASEPSEVVKASYAAILKAANCASFSLRYALELEEKLAAREHEAAALRGQLEQAKSQVAEAKRAAEAKQAKARDDLAAALRELKKDKRAVEAEAELAAAREEALRKRAELAALKRAAEAEAEKAKAGLAAAVQQLLASEEDVVRRAEEAKADLAAAKRAADDLAVAGAELEKAKGEAAVAKRDGEAEAEVAAAREEAVKKRAELAALKRAAEAAAVQQLLASEEDVRRRAEDALEAYELWRGRHAPAGRVA